jgi:hypothetical protein
VPAVSDFIFGVAALQIEAGFFVAFLVQIMEQGGVGIAWQLAGQIVNVIEQGHEIGLGIGGGHGLDGVVQIHKRVQQLFIQRMFHKAILSFLCGLTMGFKACGWNLAVTAS